MDPSQFDEIISIRAMLKHIEEALLFADSIESRLKVNLPERHCVNCSSSDSSDSNNSDDSKSSESVVCLDDKVDFVDLTGWEKHVSEKIVNSVASATNVPRKSLSVKPIKQLIGSDEIETASPPIIPDVHPIVCSLYYKAIICNLPGSVEIKAIQKWAKSKGFNSIVDILIHKKIPYPTAVVSFTSKTIRDDFLILDSTNFKGNNIKVKVFIDECCPEDDLPPKKSKREKRKKSEMDECSESRNDFLKTKRKVNEDILDRSYIVDC